MLYKNKKIHPILKEGQVVIDTVPNNYMKYITSEKIFKTLVLCIV